MAHFGILSLTATGQLNPICALGLAMVRRGHRVTLFQIPEVEHVIRAAGLGFVPIGASDYPLGELDRRYARLGQLKGVAAPRARQPVPFPFEKLDGRPLIYASMGTLQNRLTHIFEAIAGACAGLDAQLVLSLGGSAEPESLPSLPGSPLVVKYAPQLELVAMARLVITHAGLNTTMETLSHGTPMVAIPVANDQPGVAARIEPSGPARSSPWRSSRPGGSAGPSSGSSPARPMPSRRADSATPSPRPGGPTAPRMSSSGRSRPAGR